MTTTAERLAAAMTEPTGSLWSDLGLDRVRDLEDQGFVPNIAAESAVHLRLRSVFGAEASASSLFVPADLSSRALNVRSTGGAARIVNLVQRIDLGSELALASWFPNLGSSLPAFVASGAQLPTVGGVVNNLQQDRLQRYGYVTDQLPRQWLTSNDGVPWREVIEPLLGEIWVAGLAQQITTAAASGAGATAAYSSGSTIALVVQAIARVQEASFGPGVVLVGSAGAVASLRRDAVSAGSSLDKLVPDAEVIVVPSALLPAASTVVVLNPSAFILLWNSHDEATVQIATQDQSDLLQGAVKAKVECRLGLQLLQPLAAATITAVPVVS